MMRQYQRIRAGLPADVLLLFRLGDFYEMFFDDAEQAAAVLNITLTKRQDTPMCGVPFHAADHYIAKLIKAGKRVAICDQKGEVLPGKLVEREVTQILSAGTVTDPRLLDAGRNHYLAAAIHQKGWLRVRVPRPDHGRVPRHGTRRRRRALDELGRVSPAEFLIPDDPAQVQTFHDFADTQSYDAHAFVHEQADHALREHFHVHSLDGFGCGDLPPGGPRGGGDFPLSPTPDAPPAGARHVAAAATVRRASSRSMPCRRRTWKSSARATTAARACSPRSTAPSRRSARGSFANGCSIRCATARRSKRARSSSPICSPRRIACGRRAKRSAKCATWNAPSAA